MSWTVTPTEQSGSEANSEVTIDQCKSLYRSGSPAGRQPSASQFDDGVHRRPQPHFLFDVFEAREKTSACGGGKQVGGRCRWTCQRSRAQEGQRPPSSLLLGLPVVPASQIRCCCHQFSFLTSFTSCFRMAATSASCEATHFPAPPLVEIRPERDVVP